MFVASFFVVIYLAIFGMVLYLSYSLAGTAPWIGWMTPINSPWCERDHTVDFIREPANAWSDFSFLAFGLFAMYCGVCDLASGKFVESKQGFSTSKSTNSLVSQPLISIICGIMNVVHAIGTFTYHSCRCEEGHRLDVSAMFTVTAFPLFYNGYRLLTTQNTSFRSRKSVGSVKSILFCFAYIMFFILAFFWTHHTFYSDLVRDLLMGVLIFLDLLVTIYYSQTRLEANEGSRFNGLLGLTVCLLAFGLTAHTLDRFHIACYPDSPIQGHAIWHVTTACALSVIYYMCRVEGHKSFRETIVFL